MIDPSISPSSLREAIDAGEVALVDCREPAEHQIAHIAGSVLIPMNTVPMQLQQIETLAEAKRVVVYCHHGMRSMSVVEWLRKQGVENCQSLSGGIDSWSLQVDPAVPRYS